MVSRLQRDGRINMILGFLLPFLIPALVQITANVINPITLEQPQNADLDHQRLGFPARIPLIMRGMAMLRIADLIEEKRRRAYSNAEAMQTA